MKLDVLDRNKLGRPRRVILVMDGQHDVRFPPADPTTELNVTLKDLHKAKRHIQGVVRGGCERVILGAGHEDGLEEGGEAV